MRLAALTALATALATLTFQAIPAAAAERFFVVRLADGSLATVRAEVEPELGMADVPGLPGEPLREVERPEPGTVLLEVPATEEAAPGAPRGDDAREGTAGEGEPARPSARRGRAQERSRSRARARERARRAGRRGSTRGRDRPGRHRGRRSRARRRGAAFGHLPGPGRPAPAFAAGRFRVPLHLVPIYRAAGRRYGVGWHVLAAINEIETNYGRNLNVSSAGAVGWMQFMPATWRAYGVDANGDGRRDPYNPVDAIFAAARYLAASGYAHGRWRAIFAYNHAAWYVESVLMRARLIAGLAGALGSRYGGLMDGRFPVAARARYRGDLSRGRAAPRRSIELFARRGAPVVAVNDGVVRRIGHTRRLGRFVVLEDVRGNRYTYSGLAAVARRYPWPRREGLRLRARGRGMSEPRRRVFAHPWRPSARAAGGLEQMLDARAAGRGFAVYRNPYLRPFGLNALHARVKPLVHGSHVVEGTIIGRVGRARRRMASHLRFGIRPGRRARAIDPKPILDGWRMLEETGLRRESPGEYMPRAATSLSRLLLLPKARLERRVLADRRIAIYPCGREDVRAGRIDRRVLIVLLYLAQSGLRPRVTSLMCGHSYLTASGNVSHHSSGNAVDIAAINGVPILGHQGRGDVTERAVRRLMRLGGSMRPAQIISLLALGGNTVSMLDHADHIHVGFAPRG